MSQYAEIVKRSIARQAADEEANRQRSAEAARQRRLDIERASAFLAEVVRPAFHDAATALTDAGERAAVKDVDAGGEDALHLNLGLPREKRHTVLAVTSASGKLIWTIMSITSVRPPSEPLTVDEMNKVLPQVVEEAVALYLGAIF